MPDQDSRGSEAHATAEKRIDEPGLVALENIPSPERPRKVDPRAKQEEEDLVRQQRVISIELARAELTSVKQDIVERRKYATRIFVLMCAWLGVLFSLLFIAGWAPGGFKLADSVLLTLIGGTTANVLGIFVLVARYLFWRT